MSDREDAVGAPAPRRFEDQGEIARGGMGLVRAAWDTLLGRRIALKELWRESGPEAAAEFLDEARIMGALDHPNVLPVYDLVVDPTDGTPRLFMKLVEGRTLSAVLHETAAPPGGARLEGLLGIVLKVCDALSFAHSRGVLHRDIHPRNVMVGSHGQVYVMDWGLAIRRGALLERRRLPGAAGIGSGTPAYMAPEQAWGRDDDVDERTDVFGIGAVLYEIVTMRPPFAGDSLGDVLEQARRCAIVAPDAVTPHSAPPARLCEIVMRALAADPRDRHASVDALREDLEAFLRCGGWFAAQRFPPGALIVEEGEPGDRAYIVSHGTCEVFRTSGERAEILRTVGPGGVIGEVALLTGAPRVASVRALTEVAVLVVTREALEQEFGRASWMRALLEAAVERFAELDDLRRSSPAAG